jgi:hypothetical protein
MNFSNSRRLKVNLGNYESYEFSAQATVNHGDVGFTDQEIVEGVKEDPMFLRKEVIPLMRELCEEQLDALLIDDIKTSQGITEETRSVVLRSFTSYQQEQPTRQPARRPRRPSAR